QSNPTTPTDLTATAISSSQINLSWTDTAGDAQQFLIEQSTDGTTFTQVGSVGATATTYSATNLQAGTTYTFRVRASSAGLYSGYSNTASATTPPAATGSLPSPWTNQDIGGPAIAGSATYANGTFTVTGSGSDIWNTSDQFQFVDQAVQGDGTIVARVTSQTNTSPFAKAGVMFRATSDPTAPFVDLVLTPGDGVRLAARSAAGGQPDYIQGPTLTGPVWLKLTRQGNTFTGFVSSDGVNYTTLGSFTVSMASNVLVGLAVTSRNTGSASTATFDNVSFQ
ncbi:MAG: fibronectin type III domain-containing protein, partial [Planctomycetaceae bacterium]|nr:fibronectin type III domain-containing protein [Planctomycetaceae bacterium]